MAFLREMARGSAERAEEARAREPEGALRRRALEASPPPPLVLHSSGFDLLGEIKLRSPSLRRSKGRSPSGVRSKYLRSAQLVSTAPRLLRLASYSVSPGRWPVHSLNGRTK